MQAIILAAGMGKRLKHLTENNTKCMVKVNGITMIERALMILDRKGLSRIVIVVGYEGQRLIDFIQTLNINTPIVFVWNKDYDRTNNIYSLSLAKDYLRMEHTLLLESDLVFEEDIIDDLMADERPSLAVVDKYESWMDGSCMVVDTEDRIIDFIPGKYLDFYEKEKYYKTVNIYKFSKDFSSNIYVPFLEAYEKAMGENEYYESVIKLIAMLETNEIRVKRLKKQTWYEIDDIQDLDIAELLFESDAGKRYDKIMQRYGGFWRFPKLLDFCYLVNPYFPNQRFLNELVSNSANLITQYPSGRMIDDVISSNVFGIDGRYIALGNGAAELIKIYMNHREGNVGIINPTFNEYKNQCKNPIVDYHPGNEDLRYDEQDIISYFSDKNISTMVLINPDNPSGNYISVKGIVSLLSWTKENNIQLLIDESFVDFVELEAGGELEDITLIREDILEKYDNCAVVKSISKSYGVPGIRLGVLASANIGEIEYIKKNLPIWNINAFGECFMQIINKYKKDYKDALIQFRETRQRLMSELNEIEGLRTLPTQANYIMCEVLSMTSRELCVRMMERDILIKDLSGKMNDGKQYVRIAVRNHDDNVKLLENLQKILMDCK